MKRRPLRALSESWVQYEARAMVPPSDDPESLDYNKVGKNLYCGAAPPTGLAVKNAGFDVVVLSAREYQPRSGYPGVTVVYAPFDDSARGPNATEAETAVGAAEQVAAYTKAGKKVLVTCWMGVNRSGLISALSLIRRGMTADEAIEQLQSNRRGALYNRSFRAFAKEIEKGMKSRAGKRRAG